ncbi:MAG TPA: hypothetical protein VK401_11085 [Propionibacteriaceae bacterium]|nr:hypothetical protein [Propionibacteriaceae bacterium]
MSHAPAAVLHGLPVGHDQLDRVHLTQDRRGQGRIRRYVHVHGAALSAEEVTEVDGFRVTSLSRTVLDLACGRQPLLAVPIGDAALRSGITTSSWRSGWPSPPIASASPGPGVRPCCWSPAARVPASQ